MKLGPITFRDFEVASGVSFGGRQELVTHRLGNGKRVVDVLGPEASNIRFSGTFSGNEAVRRAQSLDLIRKTGRPVELSWGTLRYKVVLSRFAAFYETQAWIPYEATCTVVQENLRAYNNNDRAASSDLAGSMLTAAVALLGTIAGASLLVPRLGLPDDGLTNLGKASIDAASLGQVQASISANLLGYEMQFATANMLQAAFDAVVNLAQLEQACQGVCTLVSAQSYLSVAGLTMEVP